MATVRIDHDPVYFDLHWWKNKISSNSNPLCYDEVLRLVAYAEKPREAEQILQESNGNVPSANELKTTLLNSKENLQRIRQVPFCRIVRQIAKTDRQVCRSNGSHRTSEMFLFLASYSIFLR